MLLAAFSIIGGLTWVGCKNTPRRLNVCQIQGGGAVSPFLEREVVLTGIVGWVAEDPGLQGFILIDESCPQAGAGSRGVFVSLEAARDLVSPGDRVRLRGEVGELEGETRVRAQARTLAILAIGGILPVPADLGEGYLLDPLSFSYEDWEGMLVSLPGARLLGQGLPSQGWLVMPRFNAGLPDDIAGDLGQPFYLWIRGARIQPSGLATLSGRELINLTGALRQGPDGYLLELVDPSALRMAPGSEGASGIFPGNQFLEEGGESILSPESDELGPTTTPGFSPTPELAPSPIPSPTWYPVPLLISEIMPNPEGKEPEEEWVEIYNPKAYGIPLTGVKLGDEISPAGKEGLVRFPDGYYIEAGEALVIAQDAAAFRARYGFFPDFELAGSDSRVPDLLPYPAWGRSAVQLSNSGDEFLLVDPWDEIIDLLVYGKTPAGGFSPPVPAPREGHTLERYPPEQDRDGPGDWRERTEGSPGKLDRSPPTAAPGATLEASPSPTSSPLPPSPTISPAPSSTRTAATATPDSPAWDPTATGFPTPASPTQPGTPAPTAASPTPDPGLTPEPPPSSTSSPSAQNFSQTPPEPSPITTTPAGAAPTQTAAVSPTPAPFSSCTAAPSGTAMATRTPTPPVFPPASLTPEPDPSPTAVPDEDSRLAVNEIHADPHPEMGDADGDGLVHSDNDEFLELVNPSDWAVDLSGWEIRDALKTRFRFPDGVLLGGGCGLVVFGGEVPYSLISGSLVFGAGSLGLNNSGDTVYVLNPEGEIILEYSYGPEGGGNQSLARFPDLRGDLPLVQHSLIPESGGTLFSPGTRVDGSAFGTCP